MTGKKGLYEFGWTDIRGYFVESTPDKLVRRVLEKRGSLARGERKVYVERVHEIPDMGRASKGRSIANLVEVAARNQLLRARGHHAARMLADRLQRQLSDGEPGPAAIRDLEAVLAEGTLGSVRGAPGNRRPYRD